MTILNKIQKELKAPKGQWNKFSEFWYRNSEDILESVKPLLGDAILTISDEIVQVGDRYYVKATVTLKDGNDSISVSAYAREALTKAKFDEAQITGAASSYARKYALNGLFCIDDTKDADSDKPQDTKEPTKTAHSAKHSVKNEPTVIVSTAEQEQKDEIVRLLKLDISFQGKTKEDYQAQVLSKTGYALTPENYADIILVLEGKKQHKSTQEINEIMGS